MLSTSLLVRAVVLEDVEAVAQVDRVDQAVLDDRVAPHHDLVVVRPGVRPESARVLGGDHRQRVGVNSAELRRAASGR